jgi:hypothetical protein
MRSATAVLGGIVAWVVVATVGNFALRAVLPGYARPEGRRAMITGRRQWGHVARRFGADIAFINDCRCSIRGGIHGAGHGPIAQASATAFPWSAGEDGIDWVRPAKEAS